MTAADTELDADVVVVGDGMAGSVVASICANAGLRTLVLEAGPEDPPPPVRQGGILGRFKRTTAAGRWPYRLFRRGRAGQSREIPSAQGFGSGGSARIYGAALSRFQREDFLPAEDQSGLRRHGWPITYEEMRPFYRLAEETLGICGSLDPLDQDDDARLAPPPKITLADQKLVEVLRGNGAHPFRLHVGMRGLLGCSECLGAICDRNCKAHGRNRYTVAENGRDLIRRDYGVSVRSIARVDSGVVLDCETADGAQKRIRARRVVLAAGALQTPLILRRSAGLWDTPPRLLGCGLMFHISDLFAVFDGVERPVSGFRKTIAFRDHYRIDGQPGGEIQSMGMDATTGVISGYLKAEALRRGLGWLGPFLEGARIPAAIAARYFERSTMFATINEDFAYEQNRVVEGDALHEAVIHYASSDELVARCRAMRRAIRTSFVPCRVVFLSHIAQINVGHPMGTCRMGTAPDHSVCDALGRLWEVPDVVVADASALPTSAGANPSLTIAANATRIAEALVRDLKGI